MSETTANNLIERESLELMLELLDVEPETRDLRLREISERSPRLAERVRELLEIDAAHLTFPGAGPIDPASPHGFAGSADVPATIGKYAIVRLIGGGAGGVVYHATDPDLDRPIALKVLRSSIIGEESRIRFRREADILSRLEHPNIATVYEYGLADDHAVYIAMRLVDAQTLGDFLCVSRSGIVERCELFIQICRAVEHAHTRGVIHRDLKPSNILVSSDGGRAHALVIDFGIASFTERTVEAPKLTISGSVVGTPNYMSPEQLGLIDAPVDTRSDIYTLGLILYEFLTGGSAFGAQRTSSSPVQTIAARLARRTPPSPGKNLAPGLGLGEMARREFDWVFRTCTVEDPERRYQSAGALADDIQRFLDGDAVRAAPPSRVYQFRKLIGRHKAVTALSVVLIVSLVLSTIVSTAFAITARRQEAKATRALDELATELAVTSFQHAFDAIEHGDYSAAEASLEGIDHPSAVWLAGTYRAVVESEGARLGSIGSPNEVAISPDGRSFAVGSLSGEVWIIDEDGVRAKLPPAAESPVTDLAWVAEIEGAVSSEHMNGTRVVHRPSASGYVSVVDGAPERPGDGLHGLDRAILERIGAALRDDFGLAIEPPFDAGTLSTHVESFNVSVDGRMALAMLVSGRDRGFVLVDRERGTHRRLPQTHGASSARGALSRDGSLVCLVYADGLVRIWRTDRERVFKSFVVPLSPPSAFDILGGAAPVFALAHSDGTLRLWRLSSPGAFDAWSLGAAPYGIAFRGGVPSVAVGPGAPACEGLHTVRYEIEPFAISRYIEPIDAWAVIEASGQARIIADDGRVLNEFETGLGGIRHVRPSPRDPLVLISTFAGEIVAFEVPSGGVVFRKTYEQYIEDVVFGDAGETIAVASSGRLEILDADGNTDQSFALPDRPTVLCYDDSEGDVYYGVADGRVVRFSLEAGRSTLKVSPHASIVTHISTVDGGSGLLTLARNEKPVYTSLRVPGLSLRLPDLHSGGVVSVRTCGDGGALLFVSDAGEVVTIDPSRAAVRR